MEVIINKSKVVGREVPGKMILEDEAYTSCPCATTCPGTRTPARMPPTVVRLAPAIPPFLVPANGRDLNPLPDRRQRGSGRGGRGPHQGCLGNAESPSQTGLIKIMVLIRSFDGASTACPSSARAADAWFSHCRLTKSPRTGPGRGDAYCPSRSP